MIRGSLAVLTVALVLAGSAAADAPLLGLQATLTSHIPPHAAAGSHFSLSWKFENGSGSFDPGLGGAMTIFVRLHSPDGKSATTAVAPPRSARTSAPTLYAMAHPNANYQVVVTVPRGGVGSIEIGFRFQGSSGLFPITNNPLKH